MSILPSANLFRNPEDRRSFIEKCAKISFGLSVLPFFTQIAEAAEAPGAVKAPNADLPGFGKAKRVIFLQLNGGMSHIDTFDPKTGASKGPGSIVSAKGDMQLTSYLPQTAKISDKITVIRSMTAKVGVHASAAYIMRTGFEQRGTVQHPTIGAWAQHFLGASHKTLPSSVTVNRSSTHGNGWFPAAYSPLPILNPVDGLMDTKSPVGEATVAKRSGLLAQLDAGFGGKASDESVKAYNEFYETTFQLMKSTDLKAFDISAEPAETKARYGKSKFGQGCLLARRLIENGVRFVEVAIGGWDMHATLDNRMEEVGGDFYDFINFRDSEKIGIFISDVSGHGVPAAFITSMIKTTILQSGERKENPAELLTYINDLLHNQTGGNFITTFYGIFNSLDNSF
ncbi:MAG: DUF1501 domain-containing protein, partial [Verrucomicrobiota bacterium]